MFTFQRLDVYQRAIEFTALSVKMTALIPRGNANLIDQLRRAALSIPLNVAEAAGRVSEAEMQRHYAIARGSAMECASILDVCRVLGLLDDAACQTGSELLFRVVQMLSKMCR